MQIPWCSDTHSHNHFACTIATRVPPVSSTTNYVRTRTKTIDCQFATRRAANRCANSFKTSDVLLHPAKNVTDGHSASTRHGSKSLVLDDVSCDFSLLNDVEIPCNFIEYCCSLWFFSRSASYHLIMIDCKRTGHERMKTISCFLCHESHDLFIKKMNRAT